MATSDSTPQILLLGATGYIGGTVLHYLLESTHPRLSKHTISVLIRGPDRAAKLQQVYGNRVSPVLFDDLDDIDLITKLASQYDIVINAGTGFHPASAEAIVHALSQRQRDGPGGETRKPWIIHTSGCSNIADNPLAGDGHPDRWFDDADPTAIYEHEKAADARRPYPQRTAELAVLDAGEQTGVGAVAIQIPAIYGEGRGLFSITPAVAGLMMQFVLDHGYGFQLGDGSGCTGLVHVDDLAELYVLFVQRILEDGGKDLPSGRSGIVFPCVGITLYTDIAKACVAAAFRKGVLPKPDGPQTEEVRLVGAEDVAPYYEAGELGRYIAEVAWAGHWNTKGTVAVQLGWKPTHLKDAILSASHYDSELEAMLAGRRVLQLGKVTAQKKEV
ncbi:hypothetical protein VM1G_07024 [Cytospora mali]|uniref:Saccharopine dehydrogenase NADP binding domain-containing protein n=1 Tax=Cytospora mali TaxID=578113 RepID=A0A194W5V8_CYTMA|nr:hypothetical protein VM1G_07024 [Valsa mali]